MEQNRSNCSAQSDSSFYECFKLIDCGNYEKNCELIENGINIYKFKYFEKTVNGTTYTLFTTLLAEALNRCNEEVANKLLDQYEFDLEVLRNTSFNKALVAMPNFQTQELLDCCEFSAPEDTKFVEPALLKTNNEKLPKLAFLNRKNRKALKFIHQLKRNGSCDLNIEFPQSGIFYINCLQEALRFNKFKIARRLFDSPFVDLKLKAEQSQKLYRYIKPYGNFADFKDHFEAFKFELHDLIFALYNYNKENFIFIANILTKNFNCSLKELLRMKCKHFKVILVHALFIRIEWCITELSLTFDDDDLTVENEYGETSISFIFRYYNCNLKIVKNFIEDHPKIFEIRSKDNFHLLHYAVECGNLELIKMVYNMCDDKMIFMRDEDGAMKSLGFTQNIFNNDYGQIMEVLQILTNGTAENFLTRISPKILIKYIPTGFSYYFVKFFLSLPATMDLNEMHDGQNVYMVICDHLFDAEFLEILMNYQDVIDWNISGKFGKTLFMHACEVLHYKPNLIRSIIKKQPDCLTKVSSDGSTCLHYSVSTVDHNGSNEIVKILIDAGADPKITNNKAEKPIALSINHPNIFSYLLQFESDEDLKKFYNETGETLLHQVVIEESAKIILTRNVDFSISDKNGQTPLHKSLPSNVMELYVDYIIFNQPDFNFNTTDNNGDTVVFSLIKNYEFEIICKIIRNFRDKLNFDICNKDGKNIAHFIMEQQGDLFKQLLGFVKEEICEKFISKLKFNRDFPTDNILAVIELLKLEDLRNNFHIFVNNVQILKKIFEMHQNFMEFLNEDESCLMEIFRNCKNPLTFDILLTKIDSNDLLDGNDENILHIICKKNDEEMINSILDFLPAEKIENMSTKKFNGMTPLEMLNKDNKSIFGDYLTASIRKIA